MDLHGNAALSWSGRRELARRVVDAGLDAERRRPRPPVSACAVRGSGSAAIAAGDRAAARSLLGTAAGREPDRAGAGRGDRQAAAVADDGGRDRRDARDAALDGLGDPDPARDGPPRPARARAACPLRALTAGRARPHRRQEARPDPGRRRPARQRRRAALQPHRHRPDGRRPRIAGWEYVHIAVDDYSRLAYAEVLPDEKATTAAGFLRRAVAFYRRYGISVEQLLTDNGSAYSRIVHTLACRRLGIKHLRTRPYRPQTNGKAERFIRTLLARLGLRRRSTAQATNAPPPLTAGSGTTTINADTQPSATNPRSAEPTCSGPTSSSRSAAATVSPAGRGRGASLSEDPTRPTPGRSVRRRSRRSARLGRSRGRRPAAGTGGASRRRR